MRNRLTFIENTGREIFSGKLLAKYKCICGNTIIIRKAKLPKSCSHCNLAEKFPREYKTYETMLSRCYNKKATGYKYYGGKRITVCFRWREDFFNFYEDMGFRPEGMTLDRIDGNKNYCEENCRWATYEEQRINRSQ